MKKVYKEARRKLKLKPGEMFNPYSGFLGLPLYGISNKEKDIYWKIPQYAIDYMSDNECATLMDQLREGAKRENNTMTRIEK